MHLLAKLNKPHGFYPSFFTIDHGHTGRGGGGGAKSPKDVEILAQRRNMPVLQKTSTHFFKRFPTAKRSGKMYIRYLFVMVNYKKNLALIYRVL